MEPKRVNESIRLRAQTNHSAILRGLAQVSQARAADLIGTSETTVSRFKDSGLEQAAALIAACGLKCVPETFVCHDPQYIQALKVMAALGLQAPEPQRLDWSDAQ